MTPARTSFRKFSRFLTALPLAAAAVAAWPVAVAQMHKVAAPDQVTRAVGVYEYVGDLLHPKAARFIPVSLFIGGHFEDAGVYLARPIPFALQSGFRYELQKSGVQQDFLDLVVARNFASTSAAVAQPFDDGWFGYGRVTEPKAAKAGKVKPNCGNARVVQETEKKDDGKPHFGSKPAESKPADAPAPQRGGRDVAPDPCREDPASDRPERVFLADDTSSKDKDKAPDPERPTLHRSPETTANNTGANGKPDKKAPKPPPATVTANSGPADDLDRPKIRHRTTDEDDPNGLPPDPIDYHGRETAKAAAGKAGTTVASASPVSSAKADGSASTNNTVDDGASISSGSTMTGGPVLRRGRVSAPPPDPAPVAATKAAKPAAVGSGAVAAVASPTIPAPLDSLVAVSDAKDRVAHDYHYKFASNMERAAVLNTLQDMARAVLANPSLATDAPSGAVKSAAEAPVPAKAPVKTAIRAGVSRSTSARTPARAKAAAKPSAAEPPALADEEMSAFQLYFSAPVTYTYTARMPATDSAPERYVTVVAQTDAEGKLQPAMRSLTDAAHLDRTPRYRLIDVVDADGSNRASLLMELRMQHTRQFALYRLLGNRPDQIFVTGSTLL